MSTDNEEGVELATVETEHHIVMGEALKRLEKNKDFQRVILDGYLREKVLSSVSMLGVPQISETGKRPGVMEDLISASNLQYFLQMVTDFYESAKDPVLSDAEEEEMQTESEQGTH